MYRRRYSRTTAYIAIAVGVLFVGLLVYGLSLAITQASLALISGAMLLIGNAPDLVRNMQRREIGLAMLNSLVGVALVSFFFAKWLGILFYIPLVLSLVAALPLVINRAQIAATYIGLLKTGVVQVRRVVRLPRSWTER